LRLEWFTEIACYFLQQAEPVWQQSLVFSQQSAAWAQQPAVPQQTQVHAQLLQVQLPVSQQKHPASQQSQQPALDVLAGVIMPPMVKPVANRTIALSFINMGFSLCVWNK
jgi:hypothetical protein